jgi:hypothetical protein
MEPAEFYPRLELIGCLARENSESSQPHLCRLDIDHSHCRRISTRSRLNPHGCALERTADDRELVAAIIFAVKVTNSRKMA